MTDEETKPPIQKRTEYRWLVGLGEWGWAYVTRASALIDMLRSAFPEAL